MAEAQKKKGSDTRNEILDLAVSIASLEGIEGITIGRLATELKMSKSGLFAHFGSKESLQLAVLEEATKVFESEVIERAEKAPEGIVRLLTFLEAWLVSIERGRLPGGCFLTSAALEYDGRPGAVRELTAKVLAGTLEMLVEEAGKAIRNGELASGTDPEQLVFKLYGAIQSANIFTHLFNDPRSLDHARKSILETIEAGK
ncbi:MAG: TetR/AcrR family transcriptional regulator [Pyrinomonadaceae bacterium]